MENFKGLNDKQVEESRLKNGLNILPTKKRKSIITIFVLSLFDLMTILLFFAVIINLSITIYKSVSPDASSSETIVGYFESAIIVLVIILNGAISTFQSIKADKEIQSLQKLSVAKIRVIRNGKEIVIDSDQVVVGDIMFFESGDKIVADAVLIKSSNLRINESILTGESHAAEKNHLSKPISNSLADQINKVFSGTSVINGSGFAQVVAVGKETELGKIFNLVSQEKKQKSPMQIKLDKLGKIFLQKQFNNSF